MHTGSVNTEANVGSARLRAVINALVHVLDVLFFVVTRRATTKRPYATACNAVSAGPRRPLGRGFCRSPVDLGPRSPLVGMCAPVNLLMSVDGGLSRWLIQNEALKESAVSSPLPPRRHENRWRLSVAFRRFAPTLFLTGLVVQVSQVYRKT